MQAQLTKAFIDFKASLEAYLEVLAWMSSQSPDTKQHVLQTWLNSAIPRARALMHELKLVQGRLLIDPDPHIEQVIDNIGDQLQSLVDRVLTLDEMKRRCPGIMWYENCTNHSDIHAKDAGSVPENAVVVRIQKPNPGSLHVRYGQFITLLSYFSQVLSPPTIQQIKGLRFKTKFRGTENSKLLKLLEDLKDNYDLLADESLFMQFTMGLVLSRPLVWPKEHAADLARFVYGLQREELTKELKRDHKIPWQNRILPMFRDEKGHMFPNSIRSSTASKPYEHDATMQCILQRLKA